MGRKYERCWGWGAGKSFYGLMGETFLRRWYFRKFLIVSEGVLWMSGEEFFG